MRKYVVTINVNEQEGENVEVECWEPWTAIQKAVKDKKKDLHSGNEVESSLTVKVTRKE